MKSFKEYIKYKKLDQDVQDTAKEKLRILKNFLKDSDEIELEENMFSNDLITLMKEVITIPKDPKLQRSAKEYLDSFLKGYLDPLITLGFLNRYSSYPVVTITKAWDELNNIYMDSLGLKLKEDIFER
jgi:hypothetical protein